MIYLVMWKYDEGIWKTYTTTSLKNAMLVYEFKKNIYDVIEFYQKTDNSFDLISRYGKELTHEQCEAVLSTGQLPI